MAQRGVIVVGAGPAGVRCADTLVEAGLKPIVIDEGRRDGGQIYRRQPENFRRSYAALYGTEAAKAQALHRTFDALRAHIDYRPETLAWNVADGHLHVVQGSRTEALRYDALVICSGATDRLMPVEGWNLAGCYSLGAAQIALKSQACAIGGRDTRLDSRRRPVERPCAESIDGFGCVRNGLVRRRRCQRQAWWHCGCCWRWGGRPPWRALGQADGGGADYRHESP